MNHEHTTVPGNQAFCSSIHWCWQSKIPVHLNWKRAIKTIKFLPSISPADMRLSWASSNLCWGALWTIILGCEEKYKKARVKMKKKKDKKAAMLPRQNYWAQSEPGTFCYKEARYRLGTDQRDGPSYLLFITCRTPVPSGGQTSKNL